MTYFRRATKLQASFAVWFVFVLYILGALLFFACLVAGAKANTKHTQKTHLPTQKLLAIERQKSITIRYLHASRCLLLARLFSSVAGKIWRENCLLAFFFSLSCLHLIVEVEFCFGRKLQQDVNSTVEFTFLTVNLKFKINSAYDISSSYSEQFCRYLQCNLCCHSMQRQVKACRRVA